jgi:hypothetical protein
VAAADLLLLVETAPDAEPDAVLEALGTALARSALLARRCPRGVAVAAFDHR